MIFIDGNVIYSKESFFGLSHIKMEQAVFFYVLQ